MWFSSSIFFLSFFKFGLLIILNTETGDSEFFSFPYSVVCFCIQYLRL